MAENPIRKTTTKGGNYRPTKSGAGMTAKGRIKAGSGETMRSPGSKGAPTKANFERAAQTAKA